MSFLPISEENQQAPTGQTTNQPGQPGGQPPPATSGGSAGAGNTGGGAQGATTGSPTQFGSSASKLGDYLSANAPQVGQQAGAVANQLNTSYGNLNQGITNAANQFQQQVGQGYAASNPDVVNKAMANPTGFASDPNNVKAFQGQYNDTYTGPTSFTGSQGYGDIQGQVQTGQNQANLLGTQAGLQSYLQGQGTNPTQASSTLDALLMRGNPEAQQTINNAVGQFGGLTGQLTNATTGANQSVQDAQNAAAAAQQYAQGQFNPYVQNFGNQLTTGAAGAETGRTNYNNSLKQFGAQATPAEQQINAWLGTLPGGAGAGVADLFGNAMNQNQLITNPITAQNFSTPEQYAQAQAIQQLTGNTSQLPIGQDTFNQAGTAPQVTPANLPTMQALLEQYGPELAGALQKGQAAAGNLGGVQSLYNSTAPLMQYLNTLDPNYQYTPGTGGYGAGQPWGQGASYSFPGSTYTGG